jgi:hypothetical protein
MHRDENVLQLGDSHTLKARTMTRETRWQFLNLFT